MVVQRCLSSESVLEEFRVYMISRKKSVYTVIAYLGDIRRSLVCPQINGSENTGSTLAGFVTEDLEGMRRKGIPTTTYNRKVASVNAFLNFLKANGYVDSVDYLDVLPAPPRGIEVITPDQFERLMDTVPPYGFSRVRDRATFRLMRDTGITGEEASGICYGDFVLSADAKTGIKPIWRVETDLVLPISEPTDQEIRAYEDVWRKIGTEVKDRQKEPYFRNNSGEGISSRSVRRRFTYWLTEAGLPDMRPLALRYAFAKDQLDRGTSTENLAELLGISLGATRLLVRKLKQTDSR